jgi:hypothetical protein
LQLLAERLGVREQQLADRGQREAGPPAHDQSFAELSLQRTDLLRDGGLRERERSGGMRGTIAASRPRERRSAVADPA